MDNVFDWIWIVLIFLALQPVIAQRVLKSARQGRIARIQRKRKSRVITIIHRQETMRFFGIPLLRYIDIADAEAVLTAIRQTRGDRPLDILLHSPGGMAIAALQIARAIKAHPAKKTVFVPHYAMSGGTLLALAADEIVMSEHAVLGPVDPQIGGMPAASLLKVVKDKPIAKIDDETLVMADLAKKATEQMQNAVCDLLEGRLARDAACAIAEQLTSGKWTHDYPITVKEARALGLNVTTDMPDDVLDLMALYPQPMSASRGVEYLPGMDGR